MSAIKALFGRIGRKGITVFEGQSCQMGGDLSIGYWISSVRILDSIDFL